MIRFNDVTYTYPFQDAPAVKDISLHVRPGEIVLCTGASGCGKSTLIRLANGLCPHYFQGTIEGEILVGGRPTREQSLPELSRQTGTLFQDPEQQFFALGVEEELVFALEWQGISVEEMRDLVTKAVEEFDLAPVLHSSIHKLSEGQKQKTGLASLCMQNPRALILDEPTANLDPESTLALAQKLLQLKAQGMAILVVDHRLYWLESVADRVLIMEKGRISSEGGFEILYDDGLRERYGLRSAGVEDRRSSLPDCRESPAPILKALDLTFSYPQQQPIYEKATFHLPQGITALIGHNGAGKTTLARLLAGLDRPDHGSISIDEKTLSQNECLYLSSIVLQNADHQLHMRTVRQELESCLKLAGSQDTTRIDSLLESFALSPLAERHPQSLSGGEKQRLVIACGLAKSPKLLILDEPTSGLDGENMHRLATALEAQVAEGRCILLITHDLELLQLIGRHALRVPLKAA